MTAWRVKVRWMDIISLIILQINFSINHSGPKIPKPKVTLLVSYLSKKKPKINFFRVAVNAHKCRSQSYLAFLFIKKQTSVDVLQLHLNSIVPTSYLSQLSAFVSHWPSSAMFYYLERGHQQTSHSILINHKSGQSFNMIPAQRLKSLLWWTPTSCWDEGEEQRQDRQNGWRRWQYRVLCW